MTRTLRARAGEPIELSSSGFFSGRAHVFLQDDLDALDAALAARRPLLVRGEPGTGKTQLAEAAATALGWPLVVKTVDSRSESRDLLYEIDFVLRLAEAQLRGAAGGADREKLLVDLALKRFVRPGALWWAFDWAGASKLALAEKREPKTLKPGQGCVVLIDEIDKAEPDLPNGLLEALGQGHFTDPEGNEVTVQGEAPLVIVTTNEERELPDAFVRRCFVHTLRLPSDEQGFIEFASERGKAHFSKSADKVREAAAKLLFEDRQARTDGSARPGLAEYLDVLRVLDSKGGSATQQITLIEKLRDFTYRKFTASTKDASAARTASEA